MANRRILVVDDNRAIHADFRKILVAPPTEARLAAAEAALFDAPLAAPRPTFELCSAYQGEEAVERVREAVASGAPFAVAFVDVRMPPGIDGVETVTRLWQIDPALQVVICSAYSDYSWNEIAARFAAAERWVILKKPFDNIEVLQLASALVEKWDLRLQTRAQMRELEQRVAERTAELAGALERLRCESEEGSRSEETRRAFERRLEETQRLEGLGVLAGGIAHDFNNILTGILVSASLARLEADDPGELQQHLRRIEHNSRRAAGLCEQMLAYAGKGQVQPAALDLNPLLRETIELVRPTLPKDAELALDLASDVPPVRGDAARLRQVVMNLVTNAAESLAGGPRCIRVASWHATFEAADLARLSQPGEAQPGPFVCIEVADTGAGMAPETRRRIFEPFFTTKFTGRGLGLCAVLGIVRSHAGAMHVQSETGRGTTFRVCLPAAPAAVELPAPEPPPVARGAGRVLVADDEESVRRVAALALRRRGFEPVEAADGVIATELAQQARDFVGAVLDLTMPRLDGFATLAELRKLIPALPAVVMTGHHCGDAQLRAGGLGGVDVLQKPFTVDALLDLAVARFGRRTEPAMQIARGPGPVTAAG